MNRKITISLFPSDEKIISEVRAALIKAGREATVSHAIRVALRSLPVSDNGLSPATVRKFGALLDEMDSEDGRKCKE